jgi:DNA polymerase-4
MAMGRVILHSDANSFYASVEIVFRPELRGKPVAVCGDPDARHGIVLTKTPPAKKAGVKTGMAIWQARQLCPDLVILPPDYPKYVEFSKRLREIYRDYTDYVEAFGLDENWLDISGQYVTMKDGEWTANEIRRRAKKELGITVSVGVSWNKAFAKLGSDYRKPDGTTLFTKENYQKIIWPMPVGDLLYVGWRTEKKLHDMNIYTIGDLAHSDAYTMKKRLGKNGLMLRAYANGHDTSRVMRYDEYDMIKSVGNSTTPPHDLESMDDVRCMIYLISETVGARMRQNGARARNISVCVRTPQLQWYSAHRMLKKATCLTSDIARNAMELFSDNYRGILPIRSIGVTCGALTSANAPEQLDMFGDIAARERHENLENAIDGLRMRFGHQVLRRAVVLMDDQFAQVNPRDEHELNPVAFLTNRSDAIRSGIHSN